MAIEKRGQSLCNVHSRWLVPAQTLQHQREIGDSKKAVASLDEKCAHRSSGGNAIATTHRRRIAAAVAVDGTLKVALELAQLSFDRKAHV